MEDPSKSTAPFIQLPPDEQRATILMWRNSKITNKQLADELGIDTYTLKAISTELGIPYNAPGKPPKPRETYKEKNKKKSREIREELLPGTIAPSIDSSEEIASTAMDNKPMEPSNGQESLEVSSETSLVVVKHADIAIHISESNFPFEVTSLNFRQKGLLPEVAVICRNPDYLDHCRDIIKSFDVDQHKLLFGNELVVLVGYTKQ